MTGAPHGDGRCCGPRGKAGARQTIHVGFTVRDLDRSVALFVDLFGYEVQSRGGRDARGAQALTGVAGADLEVAHLVHPALVTVELIRYRAGGGADHPGLRPNDTGFVHLTYEMDDIDAAIAAAAGHGVVQIGRTVGSTRDPANLRRVAYLRAPEGINLEFIQMTGNGARED